MFWSLGTSVSAQHCGFTFPLPSNCQQGSVIRLANGLQSHRVTPPSIRKESKRHNQQIAQMFEFQFYYTLSFRLRSKAGTAKKKSVIHAKIFIFYSFSLRLHKKATKNGNARGSRSDSLFIDTKVKILTCNVKSLEANAKGVQIILTKRKKYVKGLP